MIKFINQKQKKKSNGFTIHRLVADREPFDFTQDFKRSRIGQDRERSRIGSGFTIVELLVVIVVIGILATIVFVSYSGIVGKAITATLQSDLANNSKLLKLYQINYGSFPTSLDSNNCPKSPAIDAAYCLKSSSNNTLSYSATSSTFEVIEANASIATKYYITDNSQASTDSRARVAIVGGTSDEYAHVVEDTSDGGYIIAGYTGSYGAGGSDILLSKFDSAGNLSWSKTWGGTGTDYIYGISQTSDDGYIAAGITTSFGGGGQNAVIIKFNSDGSLNWNKTWGGASTEFGYSAKQTPDGGYIMTGHTESFGAGGSDIFVNKYDSSGALTWNKTWGGIDTEAGHSVALTSDGGYIVTGGFAPVGAGNIEVALLKYDSLGNLSWSKTWGGAAYDGGIFVAQASDGGYFVSGYTTSYGAGNEDVLLVKFNASGSTEWSKTWGGAGTEYGFYATVAADGGYVVAGRTNSYGAGDFDIILVKVDSTGALAWNKTWGTSLFDNSRGIALTLDGSYVVSGRTTGYNNHTGDAIFAKVSSTGAIPLCYAPTCQSPSVTLGSPSTATVNPVGTTITTPAATITTPAATMTTPSLTYTKLY